jgi:hypothetical protein
MVRGWFEETVNDRETFRRRFRWGLAFHWLLQLATVAVILLVR